ncbi:hypothetical protein NIES23_51350 [Trichormus variabilis NIES-23]|uniref:Uncharacterized protein n=1 Tax=Trichormus variabilis NIES-23 TaxID=1973479 RepID=A0A1Z4KTJ1_ANAVA|nr:hypothetical protein NIES23_51350 [Trichormus variabilis NIES-23]
MFIDLIDDSIRYVTTIPFECFDMSPSDEFQQDRLFSQCNIKNNLARL